MSQLLTSATTTLAALPPVWRWTSKAGYFAALCATAGTLLTYWLVLRPAVRGEASRVATTAAALTGRVAGIGAILLLPLLVLQTASRIARRGDGDFAAALTPPALWGHITTPREAGEWIGAGWITLAQLVLVVAAIAVLAPLLRRRAPLRAGRLLGAGAALSVGVGLVEAVPRSREDLEAESLLGTLFDQLHVIGAEAWLGGLLILAVVTARHRDLAGATVAFWTRAWQRFSLVATASVAALAVSGVWLAWRHMGSLGEFVTTTYGVVLLIKLVVVAALLGLGAWNQVAVLPQLLRLRRAGHDEPVLTLAVRHLGRVVQVEVALGVAVLVTVGFLGGSARAEAGDPDAALTAQVWGWGIGFVVAMGGLLWLTGRVAGFLAARPLPESAPA
ncbi:CopD family protein [Nocardioides ultimimeridianus]